MISGHRTGGSMMDAERGVLPPAVSSNTVLLKSDRETRIENPVAESLKSTGDELFVVIEEIMPVLYRGGERLPLKPSGEGYYIWVSLSPDGSMRLLQFPGQGYLYLRYRWQGAA